MPASDSFSQKTSYSAQKSAWICRHCVAKLGIAEQGEAFHNYATCSVCRGKTAVAVRQPRHG